MRPDALKPQAENFGVAGAAVWIGLAAAFSALFSFSFACAAPFAGFAAFAALIAPRRFAMILVGAAWLANQFVGFLLLGYPATAGSFAWGAALGLAALTAALAASIVIRQTGVRPVATGLAFLAAFASFEIVLFAASAVLASGPDAFAPAVVARIFAINAASFAALLAARQLGRGIGRYAPPFLASRGRQPAG
ncbi:conserved hypothetical protein [Methylocella silvestris BL2]|uniref:Uncharacterized protein n=1 Tax=Methylocella silvestris (strain DSM 15510 / CIP 108128 / LMG 27833 / NCIMB 13906 / BL2) TaxID=395965 RepID=B8ER86_METSB|nr:hypothetical protein [Methylocella silvestris]ACK50270.1 conserved hypothetical protein [Methylocella silvestris BL2]